MQAQPFPQFTFTRLGNNNQLPSQATSFTFKDSKGFLWISTLEGLCRYDGKHITFYRNQSDNPNTIANNNIGNLAEDKEGNIWITQLKGISCYLSASNKFVNYYTDSLNTGLSKGFNTIRIDTAGNIFNSPWGGIGIQHFDKAKKRFVPILVDTANDGFNNKNHSNKEIGSLRGPMWDGSMYLISANGVFIFNPTTYGRTRVCGDSKNDPIDIFKDKKGRLWLSEWNGGLSLIDEKSNAKQSVINNKHVGCITDYTDLNGKYWLLAGDYSTSSIIVIDPETLHYQYQVLKIENETTSNMTPGTIYCDDEGRVFVTTVSGLLQSNPIQNTITNRFIYERGNPAEAGADDLVHNGCKLTSGQYIFGILHHNGLRLYDSAFNFIKSIKTYLYAGSNHDLDVRNILKIGSDNYLLSGQTGIALLKNKQLIPLQYVAKNNLENDSLYSRSRDMLPITANEYWVRVSGIGICKFNIDTKTFTKTYTYADKAKQHKLEAVRNIAYDTKGNLWANDNYTIYCYNALKDEFIRLPVNDKVKHLTAIYNFYFNQDDLWLTGENGLLKYNITTKTETFLSTKNGLPNSITFKVLADKANNLWVMHQTGISMLDAKTNTFKNFGQKDGFPISSLETDGAFFMDDNDNLFVGNAGVITKINTHQLNKIKVDLPKVVITQIQGVDSCIAIEADGKHIKNISITYRNFPVNILFSIIDFSTNGNRQYYYRYTGKDTTWLACEQGSVPINTTIPGNYTIQVTGNVNGMFAQNIDEINFTILPQWYQTSSCKTIIILLCMVALYLLYKWRINMARKTEMQKTEIQKLSAEQYKNQLELAQITNYFSSSLLNKTSVDDVLWDVAKNLIGKLGFEDCMIYLWNADKTKMVQKAGYGPKGSIEEIDKLPFNVVAGQGVVGHVMQTKDAVIIADTSKDNRYRQDEMFRLSELCVPIKYNDELIGIMDSEHHQKNFFTNRHLQLLNTIAALVANKIQSIESEQQVIQKMLEVDAMSQQLKSAQLDALRSQMDPHFIFNSLNSIENFILKNERILASEYLGKFSKLIRNILDNSKKETVPIGQEIETLKIYIELERLRMNNMFEVKYEIEAGLDESDIEIPPMLMQPYVENAILHGIRYRDDDKGLLLVEMFITANQSLHYIVQDNGIGRTKAALENKGKKSGHQSYGTAITQSRIDIYNQLKSTHVTVTTTDVQNETNQPEGTKVELIIPI